MNEEQEMDKQSTLAEAGKEVKPQPLQIEEESPYQDQEYGPEAQHDSNYVDNKIEERKEARIAEPGEDPSPVANRDKINLTSINESKGAEIISILKKEGSERGSYSGSQRSKKVSVDVNRVKEEKSATATTPLQGLAETEQENASPKDRDGSNIRIE